RWCLAVTGLLLLTFVTGVRAGTKVEKCNASGSDVDAPVDMDSDSCFTVPNGATVCTDTSSSGIFFGSCTSSGGYTGQLLVELDPVSGTGCNIGGATVGIASCTLANSTEQGCALQL